MIASVVQTVDQSCSAVRFASDLFTTAYTAGTGTLKLDYTINCGETVSVIFDLTDTPVTYYEVTTEEGKVCDGIYCGKLTYIPANTPTNIIEYASTFVSCDIECQIYDEFSKDRSTSSMILYYDVIKLAVTCDTCDCVKACTLFNELNSIVTGNVNAIDMSKFIKVEDCGCNKSK